MTTPRPPWLADVASITGTDPDRWQPGIGSWDYIPDPGETGWCVWMECLAPSRVEAIGPGSSVEEDVRDGDVCDTARRVVAAVAALRGAGHTDDDVEAARREGVEAERARIVCWLRRRATAAQAPTTNSTLRAVLSVRAATRAADADAIEHGDHIDRSGGQDGAS